MEFLKYSYATHLKEESEDPLHTLKFSLSHGNHQHKRRKSDCRECNSVLRFLGEASEAIGRPSEAMKKILTGAGF